MALITYPTRIQFDFGALKLLEAELQLMGMRRPLIVNSTRAPRWRLLGRQGQGTAARQHADHDLRRDAGESDGSCHARRAQGLQGGGLVTASSRSAAARRWTWPRPSR